MTPRQDLQCVALVGCGAMGGAILSRWLEVFPNCSFLILDPNEVRIKDKRISHFYNADEFSLELKNANALMIAVKPQIIDKVASSISVPAGLSTISIAAGVNTSKLNKLFPDAQIVRAMPNLPAGIGQGVVGAIGAKCGVVGALLEALGFVQWLDNEDKIDAITALAGSGPAYVFYLSEVLAKAGQALGFSFAQSQGLARATIQGAAALMADRCDESASDLRGAVTSKGGTTAAALEVLMDGRMEDIFTQALSAAAARSKELGE